MKARSNSANRCAKYLKTIMAAPLLVATMGANAVLIEVQYEGTITSATGTGYSVGDYLSGSLFIDTHLAPTDRYAADHTRSRYQQGSRRAPDFITGNSADDNARHDFVFVQDDFRRNRDLFRIRDRDYQRTRLGGGQVRVQDSFIDLRAWDNRLDFITGDSLMQNFVLAAGDVRRMFGTLRNHDFVRSNGTRTYTTQDSARFQLSGLRVSVPEPSILATMALGIFGLGLLRRRTKKK